jgi:penicillin-binding protein 1C
MLRRRRVIRGIRLSAGALAIVATVAAIVFAWFLYFAPLPAAVQQSRRPLTTIYLDAKDRLIAEIASPEARSHRPIPLVEMGPWIPDVTVSLEDHRFHQHPGVDVRASLRALVRRHGGGSTITQQFVKVATRRTGRSFWAKTKETLYALQLERRWTKSQILEAYLNTIPYGNRLVGVEAAAQAYFEKPASALTQAEAIFLAGLPREPSRLNPWTEPDRAARQFRRSLDLLASHGSIQPGEVREIELPDIRRKLPENAAPHFIQAASQPARRGVIHCTLDLDLQRRAEQLVREHLAVLRRPDISQASLVVLENDTGAVRAFVGSREFKKSQVNGALAFRNSGSTLKPFLYATGIERRILTAATILPDTADAVRDSYNDYDPHNFILSHLGPVRVREALGNSLNVPAVVAVNRLGARKAFDAIGDWGIEFDRPLEKAGAGFILGNVGVRLLDLTSAFSALARGGLAGPPQMLADQPMPLRRVVSSETASIITDILCDNSARLHSFGRHSALAFPVRVAAKTGTSAGFRDAWSVGFTREHTVGVWVGNFDGAPMDHASSVAAAAPLWRRMMDDLLVTDHPVPESKLARVPICTLSGLRPCETSPSTVGELFLPGTEPQAKADDWFATDGHVVLPNEYTAWCSSADNHLRATTRPSESDLAILTPRNGAVFVIDDAIPRQQQQLELRANLDRGITWKINGAPLAPSANGRIAWPLEEGEWTLEAANQHTRTSRRFVVRQR